MTTQIRSRCPTNFALDLNTESRNPSEINKIETLIGHCACAALINSACSIGSQWQFAVGLVEAQTAAPLSVPLAALM